MTSRWVLSLAAPLVLGVLALSAGPVCSADLVDFSSCQVTRVVDGDTVDVECGDFADPVRLLRIDTLERGEPGYTEAAQALARYWVVVR